MVRSYQESHVPKKNFIVKSYLARKNLKGSQQKLTDLFHYIPPSGKKGRHSETLLNTCIAHSNSADLLSSNNASDWLSGDFDNKNQ